MKRISSEKQAARARQKVTLVGIAVLMMAVGTAVMMFLAVVVNQQLEALWAFPMAITISCLAGMFCRSVNAAADKYEEGHYE